MHRLFWLEIVTMDMWLAFDLFAHFINLIVVHDVTFLDETMRILLLSLWLAVALLRVGPISLNGLVENDGPDRVGSLLFLALGQHYIPHWAANPLILILQFIAVYFLEMVLVLMLSGELIDDLLVLKSLRFLDLLRRSVVIGEVVESSVLVSHG